MEFKVGTLVCGLEVILQIHVEAKGMGHEADVVGLECCLIKDSMKSMISRKIGGEEAKEGISTRVAAEGWLLHFASSLWQYSYTSSKLVQFYKNRPTISIR